ncbi:DNA cytosine methyltransferase [Prosthecobacter vanneervenii]|uniref:Cytosine-specific methyltransferase n=1 Tax=Prosthecobacter vanneervenii TaxID=48466 RepID=A0A7W7Y9I4_9BACT|nr:DNA cytosine methyltransferase [Prosthecobacter vanneervenii]MBB5032128.1 DNA (cytosine-5)-methyltransferase 1 [Prosthecobacter vanneervenii]
MVQPSKSYTVAELFCGCGGFSHGFWRTGRFQTVLGNDVKKFALKTFEKNHSHGEHVPATILGDIRDVPDRKIKALITAKGIETLDCLIGGPPCQGFSQMRRTEARKDSEIVSFGGYNKLDQDPRNDLVLRFLEVAAALNPKVVVIENVPQFLSHYHDGKKGGIAQQVEEILIEMGYKVSCGILNAADYGVPQLRQRAVIVASRLGPLTLPVQTHGDPELLAGWNGQPWVTVQDAISDLPYDAPLHESLGGSKGGYTKKADNAFAKLMRTSKQFAYNHITRSYQRQVIEIIKEMRQGETWDDASARLQKRYEKLVANAVASGETEKQARKRLEAEGRIIPVFYKRYYWSAYTRLAWDRPALTITANANFLGSGRFTHPEMNRGITIREAARLQSFDDSFTFHTSDDEKRATDNLGVGLDMIGEAVPPLLARAIGNTVAVHLDEHI